MSGCCRRRRRKDRLRPAEAPAAGVERHPGAEHELDVRCAVARRPSSSRSAVTKRWRRRVRPIAVHHPTLQSETFMPASQCQTSDVLFQPLSTAVHARRDSPLVRAARRFVVYGGRRLRRTDAARLRARRDHEESRLTICTPTQSRCAQRGSSAAQLRAICRAGTAAASACEALQPRGHRRRHVVRGAARRPPAAPPPNGAGIRRVIARIVRRAHGLFSPDSFNPAGFPHAQQ